MMRELGGDERKLQKKKKKERKKTAFEREITCWSESATPPPPPANKSDVAHKTPISDAQLVRVQDFAVATPKRGA